MVNKRFHYAVIPVTNCSSEKVSCQMRLVRQRPRPTFCCRVNREN